MRQCRLFLTFLVVTSTGCTGFKLPFFNTLRMQQLNEQSDIAYLAPDSGTAVDYAKNSNRAAATFVEFDSGNSQSYVNIMLISKSDFKKWSSSISNSTHDFLESIGQSMKTFPGGKTVTLPVRENLSDVSMLAFYDDSEAPVKFSHKNFDGLWSNLRNKTYNFKGIDEAELDAKVSTQLATSWAMSSYRFVYFKSQPTPLPNANATIVWPNTCDRSAVLTIARAYALMKDLVDTPALSLGPQELENVAKLIAKETGAIFDSTVGVEKLLKYNYPQIAAVGMAAAAGREPRIINIVWPKDDESLPEIVIIGKGITFDTGGLNIKGGGGMRNMKRDMAGSAQALALALWIHESKLPVRVKLLLAVAENSIAGIALRPGDVIKARNGKTTEITNTDAEGRLVLADALALAVESPISMVVDFATLTGAARVALGTDLPAVFSNNMEALMKLWAISNEHNDPVWMLPLYEPMRAQLKSQIADLVNAADGMGGAITAALYLSEFITPAKKEKDSDSDVSNPSSSDDESDEKESKDGKEAKDKKPAFVWFHVDFPGSKGGSAEPSGMKAVFEYIKATYGGKAEI